MMNKVKEIVGALIAFILFVYCINLLIHMREDICIKHGMSYNWFLNGCVK